MSLPPDTPPGPGFWDTIVLYGGLVGAWLAGEGGKAVFAGAAGGFVRWMISEKKRVSNGVMSVIVGALMSQYATPLMLAILEKWFGELRGEAGNTAAFFTGVIGMSLAKLVIAYVDARHRAVREGGGSDE